MQEPDRNMLRVIYISHHCGDFAGQEAIWEIDRILEASQTNNRKVGVTGALIFNAGIFGQILEGPAEAVEETFDRIQMDERHDAVTVLEIGQVAEPAFQGWSMGFVGADAVGSQLFGRYADATGFDLAQLSGEQMFEALHALTLRKELVNRAA